MSPRATGKRPQIGKYGSFSLDEVAKTCQALARHLRDFVVISWLPCLVLHY
jgi:hypothetical protein